MKQIKRNARQEIKGLKRLKIALNLVAYLILPFLIAVTVGYKVELEAANVSLYRGLLFVEIAVQVLFGIILLFVDNNLAVEAYFYAKDLDDENIRLRDDNQDILTKINYLLLLENTIKAFREIELQHIRQKGELVDFIEIAFSLVLKISDRLFNFKSNELWNFAVYIYNEEAQRLESVWRKKHPNHPSKGEARTWKQGQGHVGKAFSDGTAKITGDALDPNVSSLMSPPSTLVRNYDRQAYRSFASIPIVLENDLEIVYGVLVATSDEVNRFNKFNCLILQHLADTLANVIVLMRDN